MRAVFLTLALALISVTLAQFALAGPARVSERPALSGPASPAPLDMPERSFAELANLFRSS